LCVNNAIGGATTDSTTLTCNVDRTGWTVAGTYSTYNDVETCLAGGGTVGPTRPVNDNCMLSEACKDWTDAYTAATKTDAMSDVNV